MQGHNAQSVAEGCRVKCSLLACVRCWLTECARETHGRFARQLDGAETTVSHQLSSWLPFFFLRLTNAGAEKASVHTSIAGLAEGKRRSLNV